MDFGELKNNFCKETYPPGSLPFPEFFRSAYHHSSIWSSVFGDCGIGSKYLNHRANYILDVASCVAMVDPEDTNVVYSFVVYRYDEESNLVVYFVYTKKQFRQMGLLSELLRGLMEEGKSIKISHTGRIPGFILDRKFEFQRGGV